MKTIQYIFLSVFCSVLPLQAQDLVEQVGWLPYWGPFDNVSVNGDFAYVFNNFGLLSFDVSDPANPELVGQLPIFGDTWLFHSQLVGNILNISNNGLSRYDVSDPTDMQKLPGINNVSARNYQVNDRIYIASNGGFRIIDVSNPLDPIELDRVGLGISRIEHILYVNDNLLVAVAIRDQVQPGIELSMISIGEPDDPELLVSSFFELDANPDIFYRPQIVGDLIYIQTNQINCIDISDPTDPQFKWQKLPSEIGTPMGSVNGLLAINKGRWPNYQMTLNSVEDPDTLIEVAIISGTWVEGVFSDDETLWVAETRGLYAYSIGDIEEFELIGGYRSLMCNADFIRHDDILFVSMNDSTVVPISIENPTEPVVLNSIEIDGNIKLQTKWSSPDGMTYPVAMIENKFLSIFSIQNGNGLEQIGSLDINQEDFDYNQIHIAPWDNGVVTYAYYYDYENNEYICHFWVVSLENPTEPEVLSHLSSLNHDEMQSTFHIITYGDYVYVPQTGPFWNDHAFYISIEDPENPQIRLFENADQLAEHLAIEGELIADSRGIHSLENPEAPEMIGNYDRVFEYSRSVEFSGNLIAIEDIWEDNLMFFDATDAENLSLIAEYSMFDYTLDIQIDGNYIYVMHPSGIEFLRYNNPNSTPQDEVLIPQSFEVSEPFPNPFNSTVVIPYRLPISSEVRVTVYNESGREVASWQEGVKAIGSHQISWKAESMSSGTYLVKLETSGGSVSTKVTLLK